MSALQHVLSVDAAGPRPYHKYLPVTVNGVSCSALLDSGNLFRNVISPAFMQRLGLSVSDLRPLGSISSVGSAKEGASMKVLGVVPRGLRLRIAGRACEFPFQPVVLENLNMDLNICGPWLAANKVDQLHSRNAISVNGTIVNLLPSAHMKPGTDVNSPVYFVNSVTVPPQQSVVVPLRLPKLEAQSMARGAGFLSGSEKFEALHDCHSWRSVLAQPSENGTILGGVLNSLDEPVTIPAGTRYGDFTLATDASSDDGSGRVAALLNAPGTAKPPTLNKDSPLPPFMSGPTTKRNYEQRANHIRTVFDIDNNPTLKTPSDRMQLVALILRYWSTFSWDGEYGKTDLIEHSIDTNEHRPINQRYRPVNPSLEPCLREQLDKWVKQDVIEPAQSPWNFGLVAVPKKNGAIR